MLQNITEQRISDVVAKALDPKIEPIEYIDDVKEDIYDTQPMLYEYIVHCAKSVFKIDDPLFYALGVCIMYELLSENDKQEEISEEILTLSKTRFMKRGDSGKIELGWLMGFIDENYPLFANWLRQEIGGSDSDGNAFLLGVFTVLLPFFINKELDGNLIDYRKLPIDWRSTNLF